MISSLEGIERLFLAAALAGLIGLERELRQKDAGLRTHILVGVGAALVMMVSQYGRNCRTQWHRTDCLTEFPE